MYISSVQIESYKSYRSSATLKLSPGINVITGQNNSGKTALLETLTMSSRSSPHRSSHTTSKSGTLVPSKSKAAFTINITNGEFAELFLNQQRDTYVHLPKEGTEIGAIRFSNGNHDHVKAVFESLRNQQLFSFRVTRTAEHDSFTTAPQNYPYEPQGNGNDYAYAQIRTNREADGLTVLNPHVHSDGLHLSFTNAIAYEFRTRIYCFRAERFNRGTCPVGQSKVLKPNSENLAETLSNLQSNRDGFIRYNNNVRRVLPQIHHISINNAEANQVRIAIWNEDPANDRDDLVVSLDECGTGVGQILAMLYVILTADQPQIILYRRTAEFPPPGRGSQTPRNHQREPQASVHSHHAFADRHIGRNPIDDHTCPAASRRQRLFFDRSARKRSTPAISRRNRRKPFGRVRRR